jgi:multidrug efflux system outer membrane protein
MNRFYHTIKKVVLQHMLIKSAYIKTFLPVLLVAMLLTGCKVMQPQPMPEVKPLPREYNDQSVLPDTINLQFRNFFPDPYLLQLIDTALRQNTDLAIALQRVVMAEAQLAARRGALWPSLDLSIGGGAERYGDYTMNGVGNFDTNLSPNIKEDQKIPLSPTTNVYAQFRSSWEIDLWGKLRHQQKAAAAELLANRQAQQFIVTNLVARIAEEYYNLLALDMELRIVQKNIGLQEEALEIVKAQKAGGRASELAVQQFTAQLMNTMAIEHRLLQERTAAANRLNALAGNYPQAISRDTSLPHLRTLQYIETGLPAALLSRRPDIKQAELELLAAKENVLAARKAFLPSLTINPYVGLDAFTPGLLMKSGSGVFGIIGQLTAPIFRQKSLRAQYIIANAANKEAIYNYQQKLLDAYSEVVTQMSAVQQYRQAYRMKEQEVRHLQAAVTTARELYLSGYASYLEVITAQKSVLEAELELIRQRQDVFVAMVRLYRALGGGWNL